MAERRAATALLAALALLAVGCGRGPSGDTDPPATKSPPVEAGTPGDGAPDAVDGTLEADLEVTEAGLGATWAWTNDGDEAVYVASAAVGTAGTLSPTALYVVGLDAGGVQVGQRVFDLPADDDSAYGSPFYLGVTEVAPGETIRGEATVAAPLEEAKPFPDFYAPGETAVPDDPTSATFCLGVLAPPYDGAQVRRVDGDLVTTHGSAAPQTLFCADPVDLAAAG